MEDKQAFTTMAREVWEGRNLGCHGYLRVGPDSDHFVTVEPMEEDGVDYMTAAIVKDVDGLGYPLSVYIEWISIEDGFTAESLGAAFEYLMESLDAHLKQRMAMIVAHLEEALDRARKDGKAAILDGVELLGAQAIREYALYEVPDDEVQLRVRGDWYLTGMEVDTGDDAYGYLGDYLDDIAEKLAS